MNMKELASPWTITQIHEAKQVISDFKNGKIGVIEQT